MNVDSCSLKSSCPIFNALWYGLIMPYDIEHEVQGMLVLVCSYSRSLLCAEQVWEMSGWGVTNLRDPHLRTSGSDVSMSVSVWVEPSDVIDSSQAIYWIAPAAYRGNKVCISCSSCILITSHYTHNLHWCKTLPKNNKTFKELKTSKMR